MSAASFSQVIRQALPLLWAVSADVLLKEDSLMQATSVVRVYGKAAGGWCSRPRQTALWRGMGMRLQSTAAPAVRASGHRLCRLVGSVAFSGRHHRTGRLQDSGSLNGRIRTRAFGTASGRGGEGNSLLLSGKVQAYVRGLNLIDRKRLAHWLKQEPQTLEQLARTGLAPSAEWARALEKEALLDSLLGVDDRDAFALACRFLTSQQPTEAVLDRIAQGWTHPSPVVDRIIRLCDSDTPADQSIKAALETLGAWLERHQQPQRWRELLTRVIYELTMEVLLTRMDPAAPEASGRKAVQARALIPWLLQQPGLCRTRQPHKGTDYMLRWAMDGLVQLGGWEAEAPLDAWYRDWLALESVYQRCAEPQLPDADALAFRDWRPSCYGGRLSRLEALLAGAGAGQKPQELSQAMVDAGSEDVKPTPPDGGRDRQNGPKKTVLVTSGLFWLGIPGVAHSTLPVTEAILSGEAALDGVGRGRGIPLLQWAFCHCLFETVRQQGGVLVTQIPYTALDDDSCAVSGLETVSSPELLYRRLLLSPETLAFLPLLIMHKPSVKAALGTSDALVLDSLALLRLAEQFLASVDRKAFWRAHRDLCGARMANSLDRQRLP